MRLAPPELVMTTLFDVNSTKGNPNVPKDGITVFESYHWITYKIHMVLA